MRNQQSIAKKGIIERKFKFLMWNFFGSCHIFVNSRSYFETDFVLLVVLCKDTYSRNHICINSTLTESPVYCLRWDGTLEKDFPIQIKALRNITNTGEHCGKVAQLAKQLTNIFRDNYPFHVIPTTSCRRLTFCCLFQVNILSTSYW